MTPILLAAVLCHAHGMFPDPSPWCTPGGVDPTMTAELVCSTRTRDRRHVDDAMRRAVLASYGVLWAERGAYEIDHLVPLELGGANSQANLWPQPVAEAREKDRRENDLHRAVCSGRLPLAEAQRIFASDWRSP